MKIILEKKEVLAILGKHFGTVLNDSKVTIRTEPELEIELSGIEMNEEAAEEQAAAPATRKQPEKRAVEEIADVLEESSQLRRADRNVISVLPTDSRDEL